MAHLTSRRREREKIQNHLWKSRSCHFPCRCRRAADDIIFSRLSSASRTSTHAHYEKVLLFFVVDPIPKRFVLRFGIKEVKLPPHYEADVPSVCTSSERIKTEVLQFWKYKFLVLEVSNSNFKSRRPVALLKGSYSRVLNVN